ncbi:NlpC/P60 family protein [Streptomyces sp. NPDC048172]|uniref:C40 family peptidase n=1 Tax=Streptomyces sp. NPDC048172 TaxID=3365505 RepID=UPI00371316DD
MASHRSPRRPSSPVHGWPARVTVLSAAAASAAALAPSASARPADDPARPSAATVNSRIDRLYEQAEGATEKYNATAESAGKLRDQVETVQDRVARGQAKVNRLRGELGGLAGEQYRSGGISPSVALLLTADPDSYLDKASALDRVSSRQSLQLRQLQAAQRELKQQRSEASGKLAGLEQHTRALKKQKRNVQRKLGSARRLLHELTPKQRAERERASRDGSRGQNSDTPDLGNAPASSGRAAAAVAAAKSAVGKPYVWGAAGPSSFDCSGLTMWAYGKAGTSIPRTSQGQRGAGKQVPLSQARPGDLVVYRDDASHVGMYVGNGQVVHAPHPGAPVRYDPVGMMPVSSVTRP